MLLESFNTEQFHDYVVITESCTVSVDWEHWCRNSAYLFYQSDLLLLRH